MSKQKRAILCGMSKPRGLKNRRYADCLIDLNEYLDFIFGLSLSETIGVTELNENCLTVCLVFGASKGMCRVSTASLLLFKKSVNMFERMDISESVYEGAVEPSYKKYTS